MITLGEIDSLFTNDAKVPNLAVFAIPFVMGWALQNGDFDFRNTSGGGFEFTELLKDLNGVPARLSLRPGPWMFFTSTHRGIAILRVFSNTVLSNLYSPIPSCWVRVSETYCELKQGNMQAKSLLFVLSESVFQSTAITITMPGHTGWRLSPWIVNRINQHV